MSRVVARDQLPKWQAASEVRTTGTYHWLEDVLGVSRGLLRRLLLGRWLLLLRLLLGGRSAAGPRRRWQRPVRVGIGRRVRYHYQPLR